LPKIDYVVVSHNHYDHLDYNSIKLLKKVHDPLFVVPLKVSKWFIRNGFSNVVELDWWNSHKHDNIEITALPVQHWSHRSIFDRLKTLWCSFMISNGEKNVYFTGDTGYCDDFKEIGSKFDVDLALIPIGAYEPRNIMKNQHINPEEAMQVIPIF
jgi:N-acyl-phosphatidylethanolamine-hydrolysing phospholipase D